MLYIIKRSKKIFLIRLTETFRLYSLVHFTAAFSMYHPMRGRLISLLKILLALRRFLRIPPLLMNTLLIVTISAVRSFPYVTLFEIPDINPFAT